MSVCICDLKCCMFSLAVTSSHFFSDNKLIVIFLYEKSFDVVFTFHVSCNLDLKPCVDQSKSISTCVHHVYVNLSNILIWIQALNDSPGVEFVYSDEM